MLIFIPDRVLKSLFLMTNLYICTFDRFLSVLSISGKKLVDVHFDFQ